MRIVLPIVLGIFAIYLLCISALFPVKNPYNYYERLAKALRQGDLCLQENPPWLNELVAIPNHGYCVVYPLAPSLFFLPFFVLGLPLSQTTLSHLFFALTGCVVFLLFRKKQHSFGRALFFSIAWCFATIFFSLAAVGSAWYIAQTIGAFFILSALLVFDPSKKTSLLLSAVFVSLAAISRLPLHLYTIYFGMLLVLHWKWRWKELLLSLLLFGVGFLPFFSLQRLYNYWRYSTFSDQGYYLIPGKFSEADFQNGQFNIKNIPKHLKVFLLETPRTTDTFPFIVPSHIGLSVLITSPFLLIALWFLIQKKAVPELLTILGIGVLEMSHGTVGFTQFGYRFALDVYPLLFVGFLRRSSYGNLKYPLIVLVAFSVLVNLWGVLSLRFGWSIW